MLKELSLNKGILWKEWTQHRLKIILILIILSYSTVWQPLINIVLLLTNRLHYYVQADNMQTAWSYNIPWILGTTAGTMEMLGIFIAAALGIMIVNQEKMENTLEFSLTKPYTRGQLIFNKFFFGSLVFTGIVLVNGIFLILAALFFPAMYTISQVLSWCVLVAMGLIAIYTFGLLMATVVNGRISLAVTYFLLYLPHVIKEILVEILYFQEVQGYTVLINYIQKIANLITLPWYLDVQNRTYAVYTPNSLTMHIKGNVLLQDLPMLIFLTGLMLVSAVLLFRNSSLERQKEFFMFKGFKWFWQIAVALSLSLYLGLIISYEFKSSIAGVSSGVITMVLVLILFNFLAKLKSKLFAR